MPKPDPRFEGCWHCGIKGHTRRECRKFKDVLKKAGGKLPADYKGAYEVWAEKTASRQTRARLCMLHVRILMLNIHEKKANSAM